MVIVNDHILPIHILNEKLLHVMMRENIIFIPQDVTDEHDQQSMFVYKSQLIQQKRVVNRLILNDDILKDEIMVVK